MNACWEWPGNHSPEGYGRLTLHGMQVYAHRVTYEMAIGPIPEGYDVDHLCRNRGCCNPEHLEAVTHAENIRRGSQATKTECKNGHPFDELNTYLRPGDGWRMCRICMRDSMRRTRARRREASL